MQNHIQQIGKEIFRKVVLGTKKRYKISVSDNEANELIKKGIESSAPFLCARLGCTELQTIIFARKAQKALLRPFISQFWPGVLDAIHYSSGVFNLNKNTIYDFADLYETLMPEIDLFASWHPSERYFDKTLAKKPRISLWQLGPDIENESWTESLAGKKVLIIHPFSETMKTQYEKRELLFDIPNILPTFKEIHFIKAIQSVAGQIPNEYSDWFSALEYIKNEMGKIDYEIALIGCGAYGLPLACHAKYCGKKAILIGGSLQLLFGIQGTRWFNSGPDHKNEKIMTKPDWVKPSVLETPGTIRNSKDFGYW